MKEEEIKRYLEYLEAAFLIKVMYKINENASYYKRITSFKVYLTNPALRAALFAPLVSTDDEAGNIIETAIFAQWMHRDVSNLYYASWKSNRGGEVDMVMLDPGRMVPNWAVEIKWSNRYWERPKELKSLLKFASNTNLDKCIVTSIDKKGVKTIDGVQLTYIPASLYTYTVGANTLDKKKI